MSRGGLVESLIQNTVRPLLYTIYKKLTLNQFKTYTQDLNYNTPRKTSKQTKPQGQSFITLDLAMIYWPRHQMQGNKNKQTNGTISNLKFSVQEIIRVKSKPKTIYKLRG